MGVDLNSFDEKLRLLVNNAVAAGRMDVEGKQLLIPANYDREIFRLLAARLYSFKITASYRPLTAEELEENLDYSLFFTGKHSDTPREEIVSRIYRLHNPPESDQNLTVDLINFEDVVIAQEKKWKIAEIAKEIKEMLAPLGYRAAILPEVISLDEQAGTALFFPLQKNETINIIGSIDCTDEYPIMPRLYKSKGLEFYRVIMTCDEWGKSGWIPAVKL